MLYRNIKRCTLASSIPQFNLREVNEALIKLLYNPEISFEDLYCAPDFATGGTIINENAIKESLRKGTGKACMIRATIEHDPKKNTLTVTEMPYGVYTNTICKELEAIINSENNPGIDRINDLTGKTPNIKIYLNKNVDINYIINYLYSNTSLQSSYGINMTMLDNGKYPKVFGWKEALEAHLAHEKIVYRKGFEFDVRKIEHRIKIVEAIIKAIIAIEEVISTIKSSFSTKEANLRLQQLLSIDEEQANAILEIKLARLAKLEIEKFEKELVELTKELEKINNILSNEKLFNLEIESDLKRVAEKYGDARRTKIANIEIPKKKKEEIYIEPEECIITINEKFFVKRIPKKAFKVQKRATVGVKTSDITIFSASTNTIDTLLIFSSKGKMYRVGVDKIAEGTNTSMGVSLNSFIEFEKDEKPMAFTTLSKDNDKKFIFFATKNGIVKKVPLEEYEKIKRTGVLAINLREGDSLAAITFLNQEEIALVTNKGMSIRFNTANMPISSRIAQGIKGMKLNENDYIVAALPITSPSDYLAIVSEEGIGKRVELKEFPLQNRSGKGVICYKGSVGAAAIVNDENNILVTGDKSSIVIKGLDLPLSSRTSIGNIIIKNNNTIVSMIAI